MENFWTRLVRARSPKFAVSGLLAIVLALALGTVASGYNNYDNVCGKWTNANPVGIQWKWGSSINPSGNWGYAFATVAEPNWDNSYTKIELGYWSTAASTFDVYYNTTDGWAGKALVNCGYGIPDGTIDDFAAYGNLAWHDDSSYTGYMGNVAGHEIGHGLGFGHSNYDAVMKPGYSGSWPTSDDSAGIAAMYP